MTKNFHKNQNNECMVCGSESNRIIKKGLQHKAPGLVLLCMNCGLVFLGNRMDGSDYYEYYSKDYWKVSSNEHTPSLQKLEGQRIRGKYIGEFIYDYLNSDKKYNLLEIGCGAGGILSSLKELFRLNCYGLEPDHMLSNYARSTLGLNVKTGFLDEDLFENEFFDCIIISHVLEHFSDPLDALDIINSMMNKNALLYVEVPDILDIPIKPGLSNFFKPSHNFYFSKASLDMCLKYSGFEPLKWDKSPKDGIMVLCRKQDSVEGFTKQIKVNKYEADRVLDYMRHIKRQYFFFLLKSPHLILKFALIKILRVVHLEEKVRNAYKKANNYLA